MRLIHTFPQTCFDPDLFFYRFKKSPLFLRLYFISISKIYASPRFQNSFGVFLGWWCRLWIFGRAWFWITIPMFPFGIFNLWFSVPGGFNWRILVTSTPQDLHSYLRRYQAFLEHLNHVQHCLGWRLLNEKDGHQWCFQVTDSIRPTLNFKSIPFLINSNVYSQYIPCDIQDKWLRIQKHKRMAKMKLQIHPPVKLVQASRIPLEVLGTQAL